MPPTGKPAERRVAAVQRALRILDAFLESPGDSGTNELARRTGINASTVSRTLATLAAAGYVEHLPESGGRYRLGAHLLALSEHVVGRLDLRGLARPHLVDLERTTGETATLSVPGEPDAITVEFVASRASVASVARVGRPSIAHATATGKVMLAFGPPQPRPERLEAFTERTITTAAALAVEVERVLGAGFARAIGEREPDLNAIAAPVFGAGRELAAILGVQGPGGRFDTAAQDAAVAALLAHAGSLSRSLGHRG